MCARDLRKRLRKKFQAEDVGRELRYFRKLFRPSVNRKIVSAVRDNMVKE